MSADGNVSRCVHGLPSKFCSICSRKIEAAGTASGSVPAPRPSYGRYDGNAWWLAVDTSYCSYAELKARKVVAQGWPRLGDLSAYARMASNAANRDMFEAGISRLCVERYGDDDGKASKGLWRFFQIAAGDLVVALEGTTVRGMTRMGTDAASGYWLDVRYHYAQSIGNAQEWIDWDLRTSRTPTAPAQSVLAAAQIQKERDLVFAAWARATDQEDR